jgi:hypothetical protein
MKSAANATPRLTHRVPIDTLVRACERLEERARRDAA